MNHDFFKEILDNIPTPVWVIDNKFRVIYINDSYKKVYKKNNEELIGIKFTDAIDKSTCDLISKEYDYLYAEKKSIIINDIVNGKKIKIKLVPITDDYEQVTAIGGIYLSEGYDSYLEVADRLEKKYNLLKNNYKQLKRVTYVDSLTKTFNRNYYEKISKKIVSKENLPLGVIMGDANGLKLVNDTFGHSQGDTLLKGIAEVLREICGSSNYVFRIGGDEFVILAPNTTDYECENIIKDIFEECKKHDNDFIKLSISLGFSIIEQENVDINKALKEAEDKVYLQKLHQKNSLSSSILNSMKASMEEKSYETKEHSERVVKYSIIIGKLISLPLSVMDELILVASLHDIGKMSIDEAILLKRGNLTNEEFEIVKSHTERGYRIVRASNQLDSVAKGVLAHHERWDGKGYPLKLKGEEIPLVARIVSIADSYDVMTTDTVYKKAMSKEKAIKELKYNSGKQFDPKIVEVFVKYLESGLKH